MIQKKKKDSDLKKGFFISLVSLILILTGIEIFGRIALPKGELRKIVFPSHNPRLVYELKPNKEVIDVDSFHVKIKPTKVRTNSWGFRDREYPITKRENTRRIIVIGDSFTFGVGVEIGQTFPKKLENILNNKTPKNDKSNVRFEVINMGVFGYNTRQEIEFLKERGMPFGPDLVIVQFSENDYERPLTMPPPLLLWVLTRSYVVRYISGIIYLLQNRAAEDPGAGLQDVLESFRDLKKLSKQHSFGVITTFWTKPSAMTDQVRSELKNFGFDIIDLWKYLEHIPPHVRDLPDRHPTAYTHAAVARVLYDCLRSSHQALLMP